MHPLEIKLNKLREEMMQHIESQQQLKNFGMAPIDLEDTVIREQEYKYLAIFDRVVLYENDFGNHCLKGLDEFGTEHLLEIIDLLEAIEEAKTYEEWPEEGGDDD
jgi:hypothetical protein